MFSGYCVVDSTFYGFLVTRVNGVPTAPDAPPTFTIYSPSGSAMAGGTGTATKFLSDAGLYQFSFEALGANGFDIGQAYTVVFRYTISTVAYLDTQTFLAT